MIHRGGHYVLTYKKGYYGLAAFPIVQKIEDAVTFETYEKAINHIQYLRDSAWSDAVFIPIQIQKINSTIKPGSFDYAHSQDKPKYGLIFKETPKCIRKI